MASRGNTRTAQAPADNSTAAPSLAGRTFRVGEIAEIVGVSPQTIRLWEKQGLLQPARTEGGQRIFSQAELELAQRVGLLRRRHGWNPAAIRSAMAGERSEGRREAWQEISIGSRIRAARRSRRLTLTNLAQRAGISRSFLSTVERGENPVTPHVLSAIADGLDMPMSAFTPDIGPAKRVMRAAQRPQTTMAEGVYWEELASPGHAMEPAVLVVPPGASSGGAYSRPGEVFVTVLAGELAFEIGAEDFALLHAGDSIMLEPFDSWAWRNPGTAEARAVYVEQLQGDAWR